MGADLYIRDLPDDKRIGGFEVSDRAVETGYFRDCYNGWGLFSIMSKTLGETLSWWQISDNEEWFIRDDGRLTMTHEGCKKFWEWMGPKVEKFLGRKNIYKTGYDEGFDEKPTIVKITDKSDIESVKEHARLFKKFYIYAIEMKSHVVWSV